MKAVHEDLDKKEFEEPDGIYTKYVNGRRELFVDGTKPHYLNKLGWYRASEEKRRESKKDKDNNNNNNNNDNKKKSSDNNGRKKSHSKSILNNENEI